MSLHLVKNGRRRVAVCSDHIGVMRGGSVLTDIEKLFQVDQFTLCGTVGLTDVGPARDTLAARIHGLSSSRDFSSPTHFLSVLRDQVQPVLAQNLANHGSCLRWLLCEHEILLGAFCLRRDSTGRIDLLELQFALVDVAGEAVLGVPKIVSHVAGIPGGPFVYKLSDHTPPIGMLSRFDPDSDDRSILRDIDRMIEALRARSPQARVECTATTDVAVIEDSGVRWLRRRPKYDVEWPAVDVVRLSACENPT